MNSPAGMTTSAESGRLAATNPISADVAGPTATVSACTPVSAANARRASSAASFHERQSAVPASHSSITRWARSTVCRGGKPYVAVSR